MSSSTQKFNAAQDATSETQARPLVQTPIPGVEQFGIDRLFDFIIQPRRRHPSAPSPWENIVSQADDTFASMPRQQDVRGGVPEGADTVVRRPPDPSPRERFIVLQRWEGTVFAQDDLSFTAVLRDLTDQMQPEEEVTLPFTELADDDRALACAGAVFYWAIGYRIKLGGSRERVSSLRFRRLPQFTNRDMQRIRDEAARIKRLFGPNGT